MKHRIASLLLFPLALALLAAAPAEAKRGWTTAGNLLAGVNADNAFALSDGRVVSVGLPDPAGVWPATTQYWSIATNSWTAAASTPLLSNLYQGVATMLDDGRILVTGYCAKLCDGGSNTELYDPATDTWSMPGQMHTGRYLHTAVKLLDGRVLVMGGCTNERCNIKATSAEIFNPATGQFTTVAPMHMRRINFAATLLADGRVLVTGGIYIMGVLTENETYDPATDSWTVNAPMKYPHEFHAAAAMGDGRVLVAGGTCADDRPCSKAEVFDPATGKWKSVGHLTVPREYPAAVTLQDGSVLIAGGLSCWGNLWRYMETTERFVPATGKFVHDKPMAKQRGNFSLATLRDGRVLAVGGDAWVDGANNTPGDAELFAPQ